MSETNKEILTAVEKELEKRRKDGVKTTLYKFSEQVWYRIQSESVVRNITSGELIEAMCTSYWLNHGFGRDKKNRLKLPYDKKRIAVFPTKISTRVNKLINYESKINKMTKSVYIGAVAKWWFKEYGFDNKKKWVKNKLVRERK